MWHDTVIGRMVRADFSLRCSSCRVLTQWRGPNGSPLCTSCGSRPIAPAPHVLTWDECYPPMSD